MSESSVAVALPGAAAGRRLSHAFSFVAVAAIAILFMAASSAPSPLYIVYQQNWHFSATTLTAVFAVYVLGLISSLLVLGALSDHLGRRPVLGAAVALEALSLVLFLVAGDVSVLFAARIVQGVATGAAITTLSALLVDLNPPHAPGRAGVVNGIAPTVGLALGALGCGALVQFAPAPTHLVFGVLLAAMVLAGLIVAVMPETSARRPGGARSLLPRLGLPQRLRPEFFALLPIIMAGWSLGGFYLSLGPSVAAGIFGLANHFVGGLVVTLLCGTGAAATFALRNRPARQVLRIATLLLSAGLAITLGGMFSGAVVLGAVGTIVAGLGFGAAALAIFGTLARISAPAERGELFAVGYVVSYLAFSVPAVVAGFAATALGLRATAIVYASVLTGLAVIAAGVEALRSRR
ncbi:MFS transporter [Amycolatopsis pithecellobii]|uniref:MFS transporter n=1 Tax=Amycolatopsis pithecellobii TaxID=664692 RepID=A0A6N7YZ76_9PSEU|nr:MFS transporter [Amycolatopsis pithecellobii]MTD57218.1 MFS transporter [Amycolatopsis pithecellobii]